MSVSERRLSYGFSYEPHDRLIFYVCVTVGRSHMSKFTDGELQRIVYSKNERAVRTFLAVF